MDSGLMMVTFHPNKQWRHCNDTQYHIHIYQYPIVHQRSMESLYMYIYGCCGLLHTESEERGVLRVGSFPVATLPSCQDMETVA